MKAPVSRDPDIVTARILDAAQAEFLAHGYVAASTNRIARGFGGSKATLFRYFPSKERLLAAVVQRVTAQWRDAVEVRSIPAARPREWLTLFGLRTLEWILGEGPIFVGRLGIAEGRKLPALEHTFEATAARPLLATVARQLRLWTRAGLLDCGQARTDAGHFLDLVVAGAVSRRLYGGRRPGSRALRLHVQRAVELFLHGCQRR